MTATTTTSPSASRTPGTTSPPSSGRSRALVIETPSWGYGDSGTRFAVFQQPGRPRDVFERLDDAAEVHRLTGSAGAVALHFPWDHVDDLGALRRHADDLGLGIGATNVNLFQDPDYKLGSLTHPDAAIRRKAIDQLLECVEIATALGSTRAVAVARRRHELPRPGRPDRPPPAARRVAARGLRRAARGAGAARRVQALRARVLRDRPRRLGRGAARLPEARRPRARARRPRPPRAGHERRADRRAAGRGGPPRRLPLQQPQVRRRRPDRRLGQPVRAVPHLLRARRRRRARCRG